MAAIQVDVDESIVTVLGEIGPTVEQAALESVVLDLYRRRAISSGKAAEVLGVPRLAFIQHADDLGIPFFDYTEEEWDAEMQAVERLAASHPRSATPAR